MSFCCGGDLFSLLCIGGSAPELVVLSFRLELFSYDLKLGSLCAATNFTGALRAENCSPAVSTDAIMNARPARRQSGGESSRGEARSKARKSGGKPPATHSTHP